MSYRIAFSTIFVKCKSNHKFLHSQIYILHSCHLWLKYKIQKSYHISFSFFDMEAIPSAISSEDGVLVAQVHIRDAGASGGVARHTLITKYDDIAVEVYLGLNLVGVHLAQTEFVFFRTSPIFNSRKCLKSSDTLPQWAKPCKNRTKSNG